MSGWVVQHFGAAVPEKQETAYDPQQGIGVWLKCGKVGY